LKNPAQFPPTKFWLKSAAGARAVLTDRSYGPHFGDIGVSDCCNANARSFANSFGVSYANSTGLNGKRFFTGSGNFIVKEIEVFEISE
jgi:hypothetical protein